MVPNKVPNNDKYMPIPGIQKVKPGIARASPRYAVHLLKNLVFNMSKSLIVPEMAIRNWDNTQADPLKSACSASPAARK